MKQNLIKLAKAILLIIVMVFSSCENEELAAGNSGTSISVAKSWFEDYKAKTSFDPQFSDLIYNWQDVSITTLTDGTQAITVPVLYPNQSLKYYGHKIMYLYPNKIGKDFDVNIFEFIPNPKKVQTRQEKIDLTAFDGYIIHWDLVNGFVRGSKFEQNLAVNVISLEVNYTNNNKKVLEDPWEIALREVIIVKDSKTDNGSNNVGFSYTIRNYSNTGTGTTAGNYPERPGAAVGASSNVEIVILGPSNIINDLSIYLKCFNLSQNAVLTIYVDQPKANSAEPWAGSVTDPNVGHTFIAIQQGNIRRVFGFYPKGSVDPYSSPRGPSAFGNNENHIFDVALAIPINANQLKNVLNTSINATTSSYDLNTFNCTDFGIKIGNLVGLNLPESNGTWPGGGGSNPGALGQFIRGMSLPTNGIKQTTTATSAANSGDCK